MGRYVDELAQTIADAAKSSRTRYEYGTVKSVASGSALVTIAGEDKPVRVPGSFRGEPAAGQFVRVSVQDTTRTLDSIDSALPTPAVVAPPSASTVGTVLGFAAAGYSNAGFTDQHRELAKYSEDYLRVKIVALAALVDGLTATVAQLRQALIDQGRAQ